MKRLMLGAALAATMATAQEPQVVRRTATVPMGAVPPEGASPDGAPRRVVRNTPPPVVRVGDSAALPIEFIGGMPTVQLMIDGKGPFRFGIETGFPGNLRLTPGVVERAGLRQVGEGLTADPSGKNPRPIAIYRAGKVTLGGITWQDIDAGTMALVPDKLVGLDGLIGTNLFRDLLLSVDYGNARMSLSAGSLADGPGVVPVTREGGLLTVPIMIGDKVHRVHFDTGNTRHPLFMPEAAIAALPTAGEAYPIGKARTVSQEIVLSAKKLTAPVTLGGSKLKVTEVAWPSIAAGNVGSLALTGQAFTLDLANNRLKVAPSG